MCASDTLKFPASRLEMCTPHLFIGRLKANNVTIIKILCYQRYKHMLVHEPEAGHFRTLNEMRSNWDALE